MDITNVLTILGRNEWGPPPVLEARVELRDAAAIPGGEGWISPRFAALVSSAKIDFGVEPTDPRTCAARVVGQLAMTFQRLAGSNGTFVAARAVEDNVILLAIDFRDEALARASLAAALKLYVATRDDIPFPFAETLRKLRAIADANEMAHSRGPAAIFPSSPRESIGQLPYAASA